MRVVLASGSPRRRELLGRLFREFEVITAECDERYDSALPVNEVVQTLALRKARAVYDKLFRPEDTLIIGCDTVVEQDGVILGKPVDREDAVRMISALSGSKNRVYSGLALIYGDNGCTDYTCTEVSFDEIPPSEIQRYADTDEPYDKAGGYAIQGWAGSYIRRINGCYYNVVGLPLSLLRRDIIEFGRNFINGNS